MCQSTRQFNSYTSTINTNISTATSPLWYHCFVVGNCGGKEIHGLQNKTKDNQKSCFYWIIAPPLQFVVWVTADTPSTPTPAPGVGCGMGRSEARGSCAKNYSHPLPSQRKPPHTPHTKMEQPCTHQHRTLAPPHRILPLQAKSSFVWMQRMKTVLPTQRDNSGKCNFNF